MSGKLFSFSQAVVNKDKQVNRQMAEVCKDRYVRVAFNQEPDIFEVNKGLGFKLAMGDSIQLLC